ncbi:Uncharacterised protein [Neisseria elongata]|uniref:Uncharacterized protein n=1 Tax=Neisseria elongata TaxID=495 RepID=A0A378TXA2_NEIEL|nr:hypothetical protein SAMN05421815_1139 [Neisseria elongata subsp. elongata]STZ66563.1 Uncharacterised protein [Neisseria elongata]
MAFRWRASLALSGTAWQQEQFYLPSACTHQIPILRQTHLNQVSRRESKRPSEKLSDGLLISYEPLIAGLMTVTVIHIGVCTRAAGIGTNFNLYGLIRCTFEF